MVSEKSFEDRLNEWTLSELMIEQTKKNIYGERKLSRIDTRIAELKYGSSREDARATDEANEIVQLLHPVILDSSYQLYLENHLREAVLNSITALFDFIRRRTNSQNDGDALISEVLSLRNPKLILSELESDSGENDQKGFMQIYKGAFQGIRNPKAHSLTHDLTRTKTMQYLVFASLLARRIEEAREPGA